MCLAPLIGLIGYIEEEVDGRDRELKPTIRARGVTCELHRRLRTDFSQGIARVELFEDASVS